MLVVSILRVPSSHVALLPEKESLPVWMSVASVMFRFFDPVDGGLDAPRRRAECRGATRTREAAQEDGLDAAAVGWLAWPFASDSIAYQTPPSRCPHRDDRTSTQTVPKEVASTEEEPTDSRRLPSDQPETLSRRTFADAVSLHGQTSLLRRKASFESSRFTLIALHPPFETPALKETHTGIKKNEPHVPSRVSSPARNLIRRMLQQEPEKMPNIEAIMPYEFKTYGEFLCITLRHQRRSEPATNGCSENGPLPSSSPGENQQTRSASSWPPFRPTSNCSRDALPPLGNFEAFLREHLSFYDATRNYYQVVVAASGADDAKNHHRNCFDARSSAGCPEWESSVMAELAAFEKQAIGRHRDVKKDERKKEEKSLFKHNVLQNG
ncbi:hypothetical protein HPB49_012591 [Dermacentor silvarum]|uniref:Uncharacterized protein n=1 Tax=Dermacentor silvarum TaxID=543639 RepID=A0ACB8E0H0_DERSI|nr:hypothetical protein HPB49_012591 [Dermacentor silvarum]